MSIIDTKKKYLISLYEKYRNSDGSDADSIISDAVMTGNSLCLVSSLKESYNYKDFLDKEPWELIEDGIEYKDKWDEFKSLYTHKKIEELCTRGELSETEDEDEYIRKVLSEWLSHCFENRSEDEWVYLSDDASDNLRKISEQNDSWEDDI